MAAGDMEHSGSPVGLRECNYPRNTWWVAALAGDLKNTPLSRWVLDLPVVLYRTEDGQAVALDGRCPHRSAPLSAGKVQGDTIVCGYHGFAFAPDGRCVRVPTQSNPGAMRVRSYPIIERPPFIWIWTGDPALTADGDPPALLDWAIDPNWTVAAGEMEVRCNYLALKENVLDLSHFSFVHAKTLAVMDWTSPPKVTTTEKTVTYSQEFPNAPLPAMYGVPTGIGTEKPVYRRGWGTSFSPAIHVSGVDMHDAKPANGGRSDFQLRFCHATTPIDPGSCTYFWVAGRDYGHGPDAAMQMGKLIQGAFMEDKTVLELTEQLVRRDVRGRNHPEMSVACDRAGIEARRKNRQTRR